MENKRTLVTAALIYANGPIHIGHLAGCYLPADIYTRYLRLKKKDVLFVSGTDEHGVPITIKAQKEGKSPQEIVDYFYTIIHDSFKEFGISFDTYGRTSDKVHYEVSQDFFKKLYDQGDFIEEVSEQYYDEEAQQFLADRYITGECPSCHAANAYGDQCEKCGTALSPTELINPKSTLSGSAPVKRETKNWYLPLDRMQPMLEKFIASHPEWKPNVLGQVKSWLNEGLRPRAMTRDLNWGIPVPLPDTEGKVLYVWFDAPIGYISMTKAFTDKWEDYWKSEESRVVNFIGKDNIVFHCLIFPAMCMAQGEYNVTDNVPANEFMNLEGDKLSTSRNWAVWLHEYLKDFPGQQDVLRYTLTALAPETKDSDFTWEDFQTKNNSELVGIIGNFVNRVFVLIEKNFDGKVPEISSKEDAGNNIKDLLGDLPKELEKEFENFKFREALSTAVEIARVGNKFLADLEPWKLMKTDKQAAGEVLYQATQLVGHLMIGLQPFLPFTAEKLSSALGWKNYGFADLSKAHLIPSGRELKSPGLLFAKIEDEIIQAQIDKLKNPNSQATVNQEKEEGANPQRSPEPISPECNFEDFLKLDLRVGKVVSAEAMPKSNKLLKLGIDDGFKIRTILSGIAQHFEAKELIGQQVCFIANLAPRKMMGEMSEGMVLMAEGENGELKLMVPKGELWNGAKIS